MIVRAIRKEFPVDVPTVIDSKHKSIFYSLVFFEAMRLATTRAQDLVDCVEVPDTKKRIHVSLDITSPFFVYITLQKNRVAEIMQRAKAKNVAQIYPLVAEAVREAARRVHEIGLCAIPSNIDKEMQATNRNDSKRSKDVVSEKKEGTIENRIQAPKRVIPTGLMK